MARGILPPVVADRGVVAALETLVATSSVPCRLEADVPTRCPATVEATAYFVVAEALTNVVLHARASSCLVCVDLAGGVLRIRVGDDGQGGARDDAGRGSGLVGIRRRVEATGGGLCLTSPVGGPTELEVTLPCGS